MSRNDVTGDSLFVGGYSKQGGDNYDNIFRKKESTEVKPEPQEEVKPQNNNDKGE